MIPTIYFRNKSYIIVLESVCVEQHQAGLSRKLVSGGRRDLAALRRTAVVHLRRDPRHATRICKMSTT